MAYYHLRTWKTGIRNIYIIDACNGREISQSQILFFSFWLVVWSVINLKAIKTMKVHLSEEDDAGLCSRIWYNMMVWCTLYPEYPIHPSSGVPWLPVVVLGNSELQREKEERPERDYARPPPALLHCYTLAWELVGRGGHFGPAMLRLPARPAPAAGER